MRVFFLLVAVLATATEAWAQAPLTVGSLTAQPGQKVSGWLEVPDGELVEHMIAEKISTYSYIKNGTAYLEEDCDAPVFLDALERAGVEFTIKDVHDGDDSPIRGYRSYSYQKPTEMIK